jgi:GGDEF domain-containing protein
MSLEVAGTDDWNGLTAELLIHEADVALYRARETGRARFWPGLQGHRML